MKEKLLDLMKHEGLKPSQLAEMLGINPAGISHILKDRNKPSFDLLQKILRRFPQLNPDWLLLDSTQMYRDEYADVSKPSAPTVARQLPIDDGLFGSPEIEAAAPKAARQKPEDFESSAQSSAVAQFPVSRTGANIQRVVLFYDDQTFESFSPTKR
ncbi:helix-turn-helix domain-containing protein [Alistipes sp.]|uniref:helix-turn-helix domain-containing protein n=1 Tax=Alistipes sp. TaxID=1872444 RepID=UPI003AB2FBFA